MIGTCGDRQHSCLRLVRNSCLSKIVIAPCDYRTGCSWDYTEHGQMSAGDASNVIIHRHRITSGLVELGRSEVVDSSCCSRDLDPIFTPLVMQRIAFCNHGEADTLAFVYG